MSSLAPGFSTEVQLPLRQTLDWELPTLPSNWLPELQQMRGRVLYADGRRPAFRLPDGSFADADTIDLDAYHVMVRYNFHIVACTRVLLLSVGTRGVVASSVGQNLADSLVTALRMSGKVVCEGSRWIVAPEYRSQKLGFHIMAASLAVARWLGVGTAFVMAGVRGQRRLLMRMGARAVENTPIVTSNVYDDEMTLLAFDIMNPTTSMLHAVDEMAETLNLRCLMDGRTREA
jgi:predicted GNAT family N-acyltransferase